MGFRRAREIRARITRCMDLWERVQHSGMVGGAKVEGAACEGRAAFIGKDEEDAVSQSFHETVISGKLRQAVRRATNREGVGCPFRTTNALKPGDRLQMYSRRSTRRCVPPPRGKPHVSSL